MTLQNNEVLLNLEENIRQFKSAHIAANVSEVLVVEMNPIKVCVGGYGGRFS